MRRSSSTWPTRSLAVLAKDIKSELRTRYAVGAIVMFAAVTVVAVGFSLGGIALDTNLQAIMLWLSIYFASAAGLGQGFIKEEEAKTSLSLRIYAPSGAVYNGKLLFNLIILTGLGLLIVPLFALLIGLNVVSYSLFLTILTAGLIGLACTTTLIAAIVARAAVKGTLFTVLAFPIILPLLILAVKGTQKAMSAGARFSDGLGELQGLSSYSVVMLIAGMLLFDYVWND